MSLSRDQKLNLFSTDRKGLERLVSDLGWSNYRARQILRWIYHRRIQDLDLMTDLSKSFRKQLGEIAEARLPQIIGKEISTDGTTKWLTRVANGNSVEMVLIPDSGRYTLCVSSQIGCMLDCSFCSTGKQGFNGNLEASEIIGQVYLAEQELSKEGKSITNVVLMGMGEPLLNFDSVVLATNMMMDDLGFGLSKRRITVSTAGYVPGIYKLAETTDVSLAISLHAPNDALRDVLVPINRKYPIAELLKACRHYLKQVSDKRALTIEYTMLRGVNDKLEQAVELSEILKDLRCKINLIPFNPFPGSGYERSEEKTIRKFQDFLVGRGYATLKRTTRGEDISAACGQLIGAVDDRTNRQERYLSGLKSSELQQLNLP
tara:strand:+ start:733 stop:1857 length:1125 start_codon:yes stop_codon:yes gene_type:complete